MQTYVGLCDFRGFSIAGNVGIYRLIQSYELRGVILLHMKSVKDQGITYKHLPVQAGAFLSNSARILPSQGQREE